MQSTVSVVGEPPKGHAALLRLATADDDAATIGTGRRTYALPQLRQRKPPRRFLPKRCVVKLSLRNVTAAHSPKHLGSVRVFFNRSFIEALNRDIEVQPRNLQILALLSHVTPMMARAPAPRIVALHGLARGASNRRSGHESSHDRRGGSLLALPHRTVCNLDSAAKGTLISLHRHLFTHGAKVIDLK